MTVHFFRCAVTRNPKTKDLIELDDPIFMARLSRTPLIQGGRCVHVNKYGEQRIYGYIPQSVARKELGTWMFRQMIEHSQTGQVESDNERVLATVFGTHYEASQAAQHHHFTQQPSWTDVKPIGQKYYAVDSDGVYL